MLASLPDLRASDDEFYDCDENVEKVADNVADENDVDDENDDDNVADTDRLFCNRYAVFRQAVGSNMLS